MTRYRIDGLDRLREALSGKAEELMRDWAADASSFAGFAQGGEYRRRGPHIVGEASPCESFYMPGGALRPTHPAFSPFLQDDYLEVSEEPSVAVAAAQLRAARETGDLERIAAAEEKLGRRIDAALDARDEAQEWP